MPVPITRNNRIDPANPSVARYLERLAGFRARRLRLSADPAGSEFGSFVRSAREAAESALFSGVRPTRPSVRRAGVAVSKDLRVERLYLTTEADYEVPLIVTAPAEGGGPLPAVICLHGTGQSKEGLLAEYGETLARRGYIVVVPDIRTFGEREDDYVFRAEVEILEGRSLWGLMVWDTLRIADYLRTRPDVDPERLGIVGHSLGGHTAQAAGSLDDGIAAAVARLRHLQLRALLQSPRSQHVQQSVRVRAGHPGEWRYLRSVRGAGAPAADDCLGRPRPAGPERGDRRLPRIWRTPMDRTWECGGAHCRS